MPLTYSLNSFCRQPEFILNLFRSIAFHSVLLPLLMTKCCFIFHKVKEVLSVGQTGGIPCIVIQPDFYTPGYDRKVLHSQLNKSRKGKSQSKKVGDRDVRVTYIYQNVFGDQNLAMILGGKLLYDVVH